MPTVQPNPLVPKDPLAALLLRASLISMVVFCPFVAFAFIEGRPVQGAVTSLAALVFGANAWMITRRGRHSHQFVMFVLVPIVIACVTITLRLQGIIGALWLFPAATSFYFFLPERKAWLSSALLLVAILPTLAITLPPELALRVIATCTMVSFFAAVFLRVITVQRQTIAGLAERLQEFATEKEAGLDAGWTVQDSPVPAAASPALTASSTALVD